MSALTEVARSFGQSLRIPSHMILTKLTLHQLHPLSLAIIAYWRGLPLSPEWVQELKDAANVKKLVRWLHRSLEFQNFPRDPGNNNPITFKGRFPFIWTGRVKDGDCLVNPDLKCCPESLKGTIISDMKPRGVEGPCKGGSSSKRQAGGSCPLIINPGNGGDEPGGPGAIKYAPGAPSPTCVSGCGKACEGFYYLPNATGIPPDHWDPENPAPPASELDPRPSQDDQDNGDSQA